MEGGCAILLLTDQQNGSAPPSGDVDEHVDGVGCWQIVSTVVAAWLVASMKQAGAAGAVAACSFLHVIGGK